MLYKTILITGVTAGFGYAMVEELSKQGYAIIGCGRRKDRLDQIQSQFPNVTNFVVDVTSQESVKNFSNELKARKIEPDVIINNAGLAMGLAPADQAKLEDWDVMVDTNIKGVLHITHAFLADLRARNHGYVINISSIAGLYPYPGGNVYSSTKAFVSHFSKNLKCDLLGTNIKVTSIEPGLAETEFSVVRYGGDQERAKKVYEGTTPLNGADIAQTITWLLSLPPHVNINALEIMPVCQANGGFAVKRSND